MKEIKIKAWAVIRNVGRIGLEELDILGEGDNRQPHLSYSVFPQKKYAEMSQDEGNIIIPATITYKLPLNKKPQ